MTEINQLAVKAAIGGNKPIVSITAAKEPEDYDVFIKNNVITGVTPMKNNDYLADYVTYIDLNKQ